LAAVRIIVGIVLLLAGAGVWLAGIEGEAARGPDDAPQFEMRWVRTVDGWERPETWRTAEPLADSLRLHPLVVAAAQLLFSLFALAAHSRDDWGGAASSSPQLLPPRHESGRR
jgi:hypothetical protein